MGIVSGVLERALPLEGPYPLTAARLVEVFGGQRSTAGKSVNIESALGITAVYACVRVLADGVAALPLPLYRRLPRGKERAPDHPLYRLLHDQPNPWMTPYTLKETLMGHVLLRGNAYANIVRDRSGYPVELWPLRPASMLDIRESESGQLIYLYRVPGGEAVKIPQSEMFHIRGLSPDGLRGYSPITVHREAMGLTMAEEEFGARFFSNGAIPQGVLQAKARLSKTAVDNLRESWNAAHQGLSQSHRVAILEEGVEWKATGVAMEDAAWLAGRTFQLDEMCRIFRVPPHKVYELTRATFSNITDQELQFQGDSLVPWLVRLEEQVNISLLSPSDRRIYYAEFLVDAALRADISKRYEAYFRARQGGWMNSNEIRERENLNPFEGGDDYWQPVNMVAINGEPSPNTSPPSQEPDGAVRTRTRKVITDQDGRQRVWQVEELSE